MPAFAMTLGCRDPRADIVSTTIHDSSTWVYVHMQLAGPENRRCTSSDLSVPALSSSHTYSMFLRGTTSRGTPITAQLVGENFGEMCMTVNEPDQGSRTQCDLACCDLDQWTVSFSTCGCGFWNLQGATLQGSAIAESHYSSGISMDFKDVAPAEADLR